MLLWTFLKLRPELLKRERVLQSVALSASGEEIADVVDASGGMRNHMIGVKGLS